VCAGSVCLLPLPCLGFRLDRRDCWLWGCGCVWLRKGEAEKRARNFWISQLFPVLEWATVASPWQLCQEMWRRGEGRSWGEPGPSACLGSWRLHAKPPREKCFKRASSPSPLLSLQQKVVNNFKPADLENTRLPRGPAGFLKHTHIYFCFLVSDFEVPVSTFTSCFRIPEAKVLLHSASQNKIKKWK